MQKKTNNNLKTVPGKIVRGHGVVSGQSKTSPYKGGSLRMQLPFFEKLKIPLAEFYLGSINVDLSPHSIKLVGWDYEARQISWTDLIPPEDFLFSHCKINHHNTLINGMVYYPSPETKVENFHNTNIVEILAPRIDSLKYGDKIELLLNSDHCSVT
jgi:hypothetical protein